MSAILNKSNRVLAALIVMLLLFDLYRVQADTPEPVLVLDINPVATIGSIPRYLTVADNGVYFVANDGVLGEELWRTNQTVTGLVKDIAPGTDPLIPNNLKAYSNKLFFTGNDGFGTDEEFWVSDGTITGTLLLKDINPTGHSNPTRYTIAGGLLFFQATDGVNGYELWKSDGTPDGTVMVKDINPGGASSSPTILTDVNGTLFFVAIDNSHGEELWKSDGTSDGTVIVKDINPGIADSVVRRLFALGPTLYFRAHDGIHGEELWKSDGSTGGTIMVKDIFPGGNGSSPSELETLNGLVYFSAYDGSNGSELWKSDGSEGGTVIVKDISPGLANSNPTNLTTVGDVFYFSAFHSTTGRELYQSDGSETGTQLVKDINIAGNSNPAWLTNVNGTIFFQATDGIHGAELWKSNGTEASTTLVKDIYPDTAGSLPEQLALFQNVLYFSADDGVHGRELWGMNLQNLPPTAEAGGPYSGVEGSPISVIGVADDDSGPVQVEWTSQDPNCTFFDPAALQTTITCSDNGGITVTLEVRDWWNVMVTDTASITVTNVAPQILSTSSSYSPVRIGRPVDVTVQFSDPGGADTHIATIDWGDGTIEGMAIDEGLDIAIARHIYTDLGQATILVTIVDDDGGMDDDTLVITVQESALFLPLVK